MKDLWSSPKSRSARSIHQNYVKGRGEKNWFQISADIKTLEFLNKSFLRRNFFSSHVGRILNIWWQPLNMESSNTLQCIALHSSPAFKYLIAVLHNCEIVRSGIQISERQFHSACFDLRSSSSATNLQHLPSRTLMYAIRWTLICLQTANP